MADTHEEVSALRNEINSVRAQLENLVKTLGEKKNEVTAGVQGKLEEELEHYRALARENMTKLQDAGSEGIEELGDQVRRNPLTSLAIAFGAGCILSCLFHRLR